jgi:hypothetical protein
MPRFALLIFFAFVFSSVLGCGGGSDKGKNKDKDVPEPPKIQQPK